MLLRGITKHTGENSLGTEEQRRSTLTLEASQKHARGMSLVVELESWTLAAITKQSE